MILVGDVREKLRELPDGVAHCVVTSPPYWGLRDYGTAEWEGGDAECDHALPATGSTQNKGNNGKMAQPFRAVCGKCGARRVDNQLGLEPTIDEYIANMVGVFREVRRVLRDDGTLWLNMGSAYATGGESRQRADGPSYGSDGIERADSRGSDCACPDPHDERQGDSPSHHGDTPGSGQRSEQAPQPGETTDHGNGRSDQADAPASSPAARLSSSDASTPRVPGAFVLVDEASVDQSSARSSLADARVSAHTAESTADMLSQLRTLVDRIEDREPFALAQAYCTIASRGFKQKDLIDQPQMLATALRLDGWYLRSDIIWAKPNPMPESVTDRPTKSHEHLFMLSKRATYFYDSDAVREPHGENHWGPNGPGKIGKGEVGTHADFHRPRADMTKEIPGHPAGRNKRDVWTIATEPYPEAHFATFPTALVRPCIRAGSPVGGTVLDPFLGSGTTGQVAHEEGREFIGCELNPEYAALAERRIEALQMQLVM